MKILPFGDAALFVDLELPPAGGHAERAARTQAVAAVVRNALPDADVVVGAGSLLLGGVSPWDRRDGLEGIVADALGSALRPVADARQHVVRVVYDGPDLATAAAMLHMAPRSLIELHAAVEYGVELLGFLPGFAYLGPLPPSLILPRRPSPRPRVPALSVGIAADYTGIYPSASPGGWHLIGRAVDLVPFDPARTPPGLFRPGDRIRFAIVEPS